MRASLSAMIAVLALTLGFVGCAGQEKGAPAARSAVQANTPAGGSLYERLGGETAIRAIVDDFVANAVADPRVNFTRRGTPEEWKATPAGLDHFKRHLVNMIAEKAGGPQKYRGKDMKRAHRGMQIQDSEFNAFMVHVEKSLDKFKVPPREQEELTAIIGSTRSEIVEVQGSQ